MEYSNELERLNAEYALLLPEYEAAEAEYRRVTAEARSAHWQHKAKKSWRTAALMLQLCCFAAGFAFGQIAASWF